MSGLTLATAAALFGAGLLAGLANAIAGGGTLFSFPVFLAAGLPPVVANASNAVAIWPGHALATWGYRRELADPADARHLRGAAVAAAAGGALGAWLLAQVGNDAFTRLIPWLLGAATLLFAAGPRLSRWLGGRLARAPSPTGAGAGAAADAARGTAVPPIVVDAGVFVFALYGGFFGAGLGVMLMAGLVLLGIADVQRNNAWKNGLAAIVTSMSVVVLAITGLVAWPHTAAGFAGALVGGLAGAKLARALRPAWLRAAVMALGVVLTAHWFLKVYAT